MKSFILIATFLLSFGAFAQESSVSSSSVSEEVIGQPKLSCHDKCGGLHDQEKQKACYEGCKKTLNVPVKEVNPKVISCHDKCGGVNEPQQQKACYINCKNSASVKVPLDGVDPTVLSCQDKCGGLHHEDKKKSCYEKCSDKKPKKKGKKLAKLGCERTDANTITCGDGVYVKSQSVNSSDLVKEIESRSSSESEAQSSSASEQ